MTATAADHRSAPARHPRRWLILGVICLARLTVPLDNAGGLAGGLLAAVLLRRAERTGIPATADQ